MLGQIAQPETPRLFVNLPFRGIAVLVQCFQIADHTWELVAGNAEFFGIHRIRGLFTDTFRNWRAGEVTTEYHRPVRGINGTSLVPRGLTLASQFCQPACRARHNPAKST